MYFQGENNTGDRAEGEIYPQSGSQDENNQDMERAEGSAQDSHEMHTESDLTERVQTGVPGLDEMIEGGFKRDRITLVGGMAGAGKTILSMQFIINGILKFGENGVYVSFEENKKRIFEDMLRFGWDLAKLEEEGKFAFVEYTPEQVNKVVETGGGVMRELVDRINAKRIVIDSISAFNLLHKNEFEKREATLNLFNSMRKWGCSAVVTGQYRFSEDMMVCSPIEFEVDNVILLHNIKNNNIRVRALEVFKMRGTRHSPDTNMMQITEEGVVVYPGEQIF